MINIPESKMYGYRDASRTRGGDPGLYYTVGTAISISINGMHAIINHGSRAGMQSRARTRPTTHDANNTHAGKSEHRALPGRQVGMQVDGQGESGRYLETRKIISRSHGEARRFN